jgi:TatD DNase family protein
VSEPKVTLIDSHCHIDMADFDQDRTAVVDRAREVGVEDLLIVGGVDEGFGHRRALQVAQDMGFPASAGIHPHEARLASEAVYGELKELGSTGQVVAIGEVGLDFHYDHSPRSAQREALRRQVRLARDVGLPLIIHTREADLETAAILESEGASEVGGVIHCFTGSRELAERALALGFMISFSGILTFPKAQGIQDVARFVPDDRLLIETDSPFLAPVPMRGRRNEPAFVAHVATYLARLRGQPVASVGALVRDNFRRLFRLPGNPREV